MIEKLPLLIANKWSVGKITTGILGFFAGVFMPVQQLVIAAFEFIVVDFVVGVWASRVKAKKAGKLDEWGFESKKAWKTIWKLVFVIIGIVLCYHLDVVVLNFVDLRLPQLFCGFVCGVELWSFLENAACISDHKVFKWLKRYMGSKVADYIPTPDELQKDDKE